MDKKVMSKDQKVGLTVTVLTVFILVFIFAGITYAFFTANNPEGSTAQIISDTGRMLITYDDGTDSITPVTNIQPSNAILVNKTFTLTGSNTTVGTSEGDGLVMPYKVGLKYVSTFSDGMLHYYIKEVERPESSKVTTEYSGVEGQTVQGNSNLTGFTHGTIPKGNRYFELVTGEFPAKLEDQKITFNLIFQFPDNNENQDSEKGKSFNGKIVINHDSNISDYIANLDKTENSIEIDDTPDNNLRYVGANPKNYVQFNDELWRIIGIFNVYNTETNQNENLVKIIRDEPLGNYSWDTSSSTDNNGYGHNEWSQADLMYELNCDGNLSSSYCRSEDINDGYLSNITTGTTLWYNGGYNSRTGTYDYSNNIKSSSINKIAKVRWNLGGAQSSMITALEMYNAERGTKHTTLSDGITRTDYWDGKIGLMYPSDYGYASTNEECRNELSSHTIGVSNYNCYNNNWLSDNKFEWTLTPGLSTLSAGFIRQDGYPGFYDNNAPYYVRPTLFLKSNIVISDGTGTKEDPFKLDYSFKDDSWDVIAANLKAGKSYLYNVGDEKEVTIDGTDFTVRIANKSTPSDCSKDDFSQTSCGFVIEFVDIVDGRVMNTDATNVGGWEASELRNYLNNEFISKLPADLQNIITTTKVVSGHGGTEGEENFVTNDKIFLLGTHEVYTNEKFMPYDTDYSNTRQLDYYAKYNVTDNENNQYSLKKYYKYNNGSVGYFWWLRSSYNFDNNAQPSSIVTEFWCASPSGSLAAMPTNTTNQISATEIIGLGVAPAFRIG